MFIDELERIAAPFELYVDEKGVLYCQQDLDEYENEKNGADA